MKKVVWIIWGLVTLALAGYYGNAMFLSEDKSELLIGETTYGHYQIEMACTSCHTSAFGGEEVIQDACESCHAEELKLAHDSHPKKKFNDPRNADRLEILDARYCVTCHTEHQNEKTHPMGLTIPEDYCWHCHQEVGEERPSHEGLGYETCASAGCHNYHDNRALYERFLVDNADQPWVDRMAVIAANDSGSYHGGKDKVETGDTQRAESDPLATQNFAGVEESRDGGAHWDDHLHVKQGVACASCHVAQEPASANWNPSPGAEQCQSCHQQETKGFLASRHGMRVVQGLPALTPSDSRALSFESQSMNKAHGCMACHAADKSMSDITAGQGVYHPEFAATEACLGCHQDEHSKAFESSPHALDSSASITCATCHLPRITGEQGAQKRVRVEHNQSFYLRPNEKMIRPVCMQCHSLAFAIDALADENLINNNFNGQPAEHVPSIDWALKREREAAN